MPSTALLIIYVLPHEREQVESLPGFIPVEYYGCRHLPNELGCVVSDMIFRGTAGEVVARYFLQQD